jgi:hypothetical protein
VTIFDTPGDPPDLTFLNDFQYYRPSIQIRVRNNDYMVGWDLINDIKNELHGKYNETWNGTVYTLIQCFLEPTFLDWDNNNRAWFVTTFNLQRKEGA